MPRACLAAGDGESRPGLPPSPSKKQRNQIEANPGYDSAPQFSRDVGTSGPKINSKGIRREERKGAWRSGRAQTPPPGRPALTSGCEALAQLEDVVAVLRGKRSRNSKKEKEKREK